MILTGLVHTNRHLPLLQKHTSLPQTADSSVTGFVHAKGHWQVAVRPSKEAAHVEYLGQVSFEQGSLVPGNKETRKR